MKTAQVHDHSRAYKPLASSMRQLPRVASLLPGALSAGETPAHRASSQCTALLCRLGRTLQASIAHIGGSQFALKEVKRNGNHRDPDQFFNSGSHLRATDRAAPHNVYTSFARLGILSHLIERRATRRQPLQHGHAKMAKRRQARCHPNRRHNQRTVV